MTGYTWTRCLAMLAVPDRQKLASRFGLRPDVDALTEYFTNPDATVARIAALSSEAQELLARAWLAGSQVPLDALLTSTGRDERLCSRATGSMEKAAGPCESPSRP